MQRARVVVLDHTAKEGGAELALLRVCRRLYPERFDISVLVFEDGAFVTRLRAAGIPAEALPLSDDVAHASRTDLLASPLALLRRTAGALWFVPRLARAIRATRADLIVANSLKAAVFASVVAPLTRRPWVWHLHDRLTTDYLSKPLVTMLHILAVVGPRGIVVNSRATLATLPRRVAGKVTVAYPGLDPAEFHSSARPAEVTVVGMVGRISPTKGQREFLRAAARIADEHPDARFRIVGAALFGEHGYEAEIRALPARLGVDDRVEFAGWVDDPAAEVGGLAVLVHASPVPEPFGQVVVEAMAAGVPVVATDAGGVTEILEPNGSGIATSGPWRVTPFGVLVSPGDDAALADAIRWVLTNADERERKAAAAQEYAINRFSIARTADAVYSAWDGVLNSR